MSIAPRFGIEAGRTPKEEQFLAALNAHAENGNWFADGWEFNECLTITVSISDEEYNTILRTLRADFYGEEILVGSDETHQLVTMLEKSKNGVLDAASENPVDLAGFAAKWFEGELRRPIERREWKRTSFTHTEWVLADTNQVIVWSDSENRTRAELGIPDRVSQIK